MKPVRFLGDSLERIREFDSDVRQDIGFQLHKLQQGLRADDWKPLASIGKGVEELRVWSESGTYRIVYVAKLQEAVYVLHAFQKKSQATSQRDLRLAFRRYADLVGGDT